MRKRSVTGVAHSVRRRFTPTDAKRLAEGGTHVLFAYITQFTAARRGLRRQRR